MRSPFIQRSRIFSLLIAVLVILGPAPPSRGQDPDRLRNAKALFFDGKYAEARQAWEAILSSSRGAQADTAAYWVARSSENLGELERAFKEYGDFLARRPADRALAEEARTSRIGLAARLHKAGKRERLPVLTEGLSDPSKTVRYYAALQLSSLCPEAGQPAVPLLRQILEQEKDPDLVDRATLGLLKCDPQALSKSVAPRSVAPKSVAPRAPTSPGGPVRWIKVRIFQKDGAKPHVSINLPLALAEMVFKSLPEEAKRDLRRKGYDADHFWEQLRKLGPTEIIHIEGDDGEKIQIWIE